MELIPAIDLREGRVVRLRQGDFAAETRYAVGAAALLRRYRAAGARRVHVVDLEAARRGEGRDAGWLEALTKGTKLRIQVGGGVRRVADVERLLDAGAERVVVGSVAVHAPARFAGWIRRFGAERLVAALDVRVGDDGIPRLASHGWQRATRRPLWTAAAGLARAGLRHAICTDIARDGLLAGPNLALYVECLRRCPGIEWQASGGLRDAGDLRALAMTGIAAAISGRALLERRIPLAELAACPPAA